MSNTILSIIGITVSLIGLGFTIYQVMGLKRTTKDYQEQVKKEVEQAQKKIRDGLYISEVTLCIKNLESAIKFIRDGNTELALLRMEDIETTLHNYSLSEKYLDENQMYKFNEAIINYKDSLRSVIKNTNGDNIDKNYILDSLMVIREYLSIIDNCIKVSLYEKRS